MRFLLPILLILLIVPTWSGSERLPLLDPHIPVHIAPVRLDEGDPVRTRDGALEFLGGWHLTSRDHAFGGFSSMSVEGDRFTLLSDGGNYLRFDMAAPGRLSNVAVGALPAGPGAGWEKRNRDSESMTVDPVTGNRWVGFEDSNSIWRYGRDFALPAKGVIPHAIRNWPRSGGPEAMVRLRDGHFLVFGESARWPGAMHAGRSAVFFAGDPVEHPGKGFRFAFLPPQGFEPTDVAELPDGRLLLLVRRFRLPYNFTARLVLLDRRAIKPGAVVAGKTIALFEPPLIHDNFEGIAITREGADTIVWIASDDNQSILQRSLLLKFRLKYGQTKTPARRTGVR